MARKKSASDHGNEQTDKENVSTRASWSDLDDKILVQHLVSVKKKGNPSDNGFKMQVWVAVAERLAKENPSRVVKTAAQCQDHWTTLKSNYNSVEKLRNASGFGWDDGTKTVVAEESVWSAYIKAHKKAKYWKTHPFPLYDDINYLVKGIVATGAAAFHAGEQPSAGSNDSAPVSTDRPESSPPTSSTSSAKTADSGGGSESGAHMTGILYDETAKEIMQPDPQPDQPTQAESAHTPHPSNKRPRSESPSPSVPSKRQKKGCRHARGSESISEVASAIRELSKTFTGGGAPTPERRKRAIELLEEDGGFSDDEQVLVMGLFADNMAVADTFLGIGKQRVRTTFIHSKLRDHRL